MTSAAIAASQYKITDHHAAAHEDTRGTNNNPLAVELISTKEGEEAARKQDEERAQKVFVDKVTIGIGIIQCFVFLLQLIAFVAQACYLRTTVREMRVGTKATIKAANAAKKSADVSEAALKDLERASVFLNQFLPTPEFGVNNQIQEWVLQPQWINTGRTATKNGVHCCSWGLYDAPLPSDFAFPNNLGYGGTSDPEPVFISPQSTTEGRSCIIHVSTLRDAKELRKYVYVWGWIEYDDIFRNTIRHRTEYCFMLAMFGRPQFLQPQDFRWTIHREHNGADGECMRKPSPYAFVSKRILAPLT